MGVFLRLKGQRQLCLRSGHLNYPSDQITFFRIFVAFFLAFLWLFEVKRKSGVWHLTASGSEGEGTGLT